MKIIVVGATGTIGAAVAKALAACHRLLGETVSYLFAGWKSTGRLL